ncbi:MAG: FAD-dependent oxidoreductase [Steroidobacteraceae bacterium]
MGRDRVSKRRFLGGLGALAGATALPGALAATPATTGEAARAGSPMPDPRALARVRWDVIVVGAGNSGLPAAIFAARRGARVLLVDAAERIGGTLLLSSGQMSAGGTVLQRSKGIQDTPQEHFDDVMRISQGTANRQMVRLAVDHAPAMADWLFAAGFTARAEHPVLGGGGHDPYTKARYFWGENGGLSILRILENELQPLVDAGKVTVLLQTRATSLLQRRGGAVEGIAATGADGRAVEYRGRSVVLTCGGYGSNGEMFERLEGIRDYADTVYPYSQGAGIIMGLAAGGYLRGAELRQPLFNAVLQEESAPSRILVRLVTDPTQREPWEIYVNVRGERFLQEDTLTFDAKEKALKGQPDERCWVVFDQAILDAAPKPPTRSWSKAEYAEAFGSFPTFYKADTLQALAAAARIDAAGLAATVVEYNAAQASGRDRLGRRHMPLPIAKPPFYAIRMQGYYLVDSAGLAVDTRLRVLRQDGRAIPNLYAAGELLGMGTLQGSSYPGGMSVTPALTFGKLLGEKLLPV